MRPPATDTISWLTGWFTSQCNEDWEHGYGVRIESVDNPGWMIRVDLGWTEWEGIDMPMQKVDLSDNDWYFARVQDNEFYGSGDSSKLDLLIRLFREFIEDHEPASGA